MAITLYHCPGSAPCHTVRIVARMLGVDLRLNRICITEGEQMKEEFLKINPLHTVPTIVDGDFILCESRAIVTYLCDQYPKGDISAALYPRDPKKRAQITKWLVYGAEKTFLKVLDYVMPHWFLKQPTDEARKAMEENFDVLDKILKGTKYLTGDTLTLADISLRCSIGQLDYTHYTILGRKNLQDWMRRVDAVPERKAIRKDFLEYLDQCRKNGEIM